MRSGVIITGGRYRRASGGEAPTGPGTRVSAGHVNLNNTHHQRGSGSRRRATDTWAGTTDADCPPARHGGHHGLDLWGSEPDGDGDHSDGKDGWGGEWRRPWLHLHIRTFHGISRRGQAAESGTGSNHFHGNLDWHFRLSNLHLNLHLSKEVWDNNKWTGVHYFAGDCLFKNCVGFGKMLFCPTAPGHTDLCHWHHHSGRPAQLHHVFHVKTLKKVYYRQLILIRGQNNNLNILYLQNGENS